MIITKDKKTIKKRIRNKMPAENKIHDERIFPAYIPNMGETNIDHTSIRHSG